MSARRQSFLPSLASLFLALLLLYGLSAPLLSGDLGWQVAVGRFILHHGDFPSVNFLSWTTPWHPWQTHEWLACVLFSLLDSWGGLPLILLARGLLYVAPLFILWRLGRRHQAEPLALALLILFTGLTLALNVAARPWLFSNLLLAFALWMHPWLRKAPTDSLGARWWWSLPLLGLWINLHGGFALGVVLFALSFVVWSLHRLNGLRDGLRRLEVAGAMTIALLYCLVLNPYGVNAMVTPFLYLLGDQSSGLALTGQIKEWGPLELESFFGGVYLIWCGLASLVVVASRRARGRPELWLGILFLVLTLKVQRFLPLAALLLVPPLAEGLLRPLGQRLETTRQEGVWAFLAGMSRQEGRPRPLATGICLLLPLLVCGTWSLDRDFVAQRLAAKQYPQEAVLALGQLEPGRLYNHYDWAGLVAWKAPEHRLFITPANDAYPRALFEDWLRIANLGDGWEALLERYGVDTVLMPTSTELIRRLKREPQWQVIHQDARATLLRRPALGPTPGPPGARPMGGEGRR